MPQARNQRWAGRMDREPAARAAGQAARQYLDCWTRCCEAMGLMFFPDPARGLSEFHRGLECLAPLAAAAGRRPMVFMIWFSHPGPPPSPCRPAPELRPPPPGRGSTRLPVRHQTPRPARRPSGRETQSTPRPHASASRRPGARGLALKPRPWHHVPFASLARAERVRLSCPKELGVLPLALEAPFQCCFTGSRRKIRPPPTTPSDGRDRRVRRLDVMLGQKGPRLGRLRRVACVCHSPSGVGS
jgi:hypothetical protein